MENAMDTLDATIAQPNELVCPRDEKSARPSSVERLRVAIVDEELPYPATSGKRIRTSNLVLRLARRHRIVYLCHRNADPAEAVHAREYYQDHGVEVCMVERSVPPKSGLGFYARLAGNLLSSLPYSVTSHDSPALRSKIKEYAATHTVDLWQCEWTPYAQALQSLQGVRRVVMAHNVESLIWQRYYETETNPLKRWYIGKQWRKFERFERSVIRAATRTIAVSAEDAALMSKRFGASRVEVVDNGVDTRYFRPAGANREAGRILFLGSLDWRPNLDAAAMLLEKVFPAVLKAEPAAQLVLVGRNPPESLRQQIAAAPHVELHADVADVRPYLLNSSVMAVPLRIGGGSRLKILEALACGLPVVSTRIGAEGLRLEAGRHLLVVDEIADIAQTLVRCLREPAPALAMAERGRRVVLARYDWDALADRLEDVWLETSREAA